MCVFFYVPHAQSIVLFTGMAVEKEDVLRKMRFRFSDEKKGDLNQIFSPLQPAINTGPFVFLTSVPTCGTKYQPCRAERLWKPALYVGYC